MNTDNKSEASELRGKAENLANKRRLEENSRHSEVDTLRLIHELEVHQIELEMQRDEYILLSERQQALISAIPDIIMEVDTRKVYTWANQAGLNFFGEDVIGREVSYYLEGEQDTYRKVSPLFKGMEDDIYVESWQRRKDGEKRLLAWHCRTLKNPEGKVTGVLSTAQDITYRVKAEESLRSSEAKYRLLVESSGIGVGLFTLDGKILYFNSKATENLGGKPEDFIGKSLEEVFGPVEAAKYIDRFREVVRCKSSIDYEDYIELPSGKSVWFLSNHMRVMNNDGSIAGIQVIAHDITQHKKAEMALKESEDKYKKLVELSPDAIVVHCDGKIEYANKAAVDSMGGVTAADLIGRNALEFVHPEYRSLAIERIRNLIDNNAKAALTHEKFIRLDGKIIDVETTAIPFVLGGKPSVQLIVRDISERIQMEEALRNSEAQYRLLADNMSDLVWLMDLDLNTTFISPSILKKGGFTLEELQKIPFEKKITPASLKVLMDRIEKEMPEIISNPEYYSDIPIDLEVCHKNGTTYWLEIVYNIIHDDKGNSVSILCVGRDITQHKLLAEKLEESEEKLNLFFSQSLDGFFFMMLDEPVVWNDLTDKEKTLDYVFRHQKVTKINKAMLDQYGATEEQILGYTPAEFFSHDILQGRRIWKDLFDKGHIHEDTYEKKLDGTEIVIEGDYICLYDEENRITGNFGIQRDVTVARRSERALLDNERHLRFITNHLPVSIAHIDNKKQYKFVNQPYAEMLGKHPGDFVGKLIPDVLGEAAFRKAEPFMDMALAGEIAVFEMVLEPAKDEPHTISVHYIPESDNDGKIVGFIASIIDITARKQAEAKIQHQLEELQRWQIVTLGREDRNMELKKEVNELLLSLGQPIRYPSQENRSSRTQTDDLSKNE